MPCLTSTKDNAERMAMIKLTDSIEDVQKARELVNVAIDLLDPTGHTERGHAGITDRYPLPRPRNIGWAIGTIAEVEELLYKLEDDLSVIEES